MRVSLVESVVLEVGVGEGRTRSESKSFREVRVKFPKRERNAQIALYRWS